MYFSGNPGTNYGKTTKVGSWVEVKTALDLFWQIYSFEYIH